MELNGVYEGSSWSPASGDARLLRLEVVCVSSTPAVGEQKTSLSMLVEIAVIICCPQIINMRKILLLFNLTFITQT